MEKDQDTLTVTRPMRETMIGAGAKAVVEAWGPTDSVWDSLASDQAQELAEAALDSFLACLSSPTSEAVEAMAREIFKIARAVPCPSYSPAWKDYERDVRASLSALVQALREGK